MSTWRTFLDDALAARPELKARVRDVTEEHLVPTALKISPPASGPKDVARLKAALERASTAPPAPPSTRAVFPVTHLQDFFLCPRRYLYARQVRLSEFPIAFELEPEIDLSDGKSVADPRLRGTLAHKLLETLDFRWALETPKHQEKALKELLWAQGISPGDEGATELLAWVLGFLRTDFAAKLAALPPERVHRELPFLLRLDGPSGASTLHLKGQIDLLVEEAPGRFCVIDYKAARRHPRGLEPYSFQLQCYALAASHFAPPGSVVETGISFLQEKRPEPERTVVDSESLTALRQKLCGPEVSLLLSAHPGEWPSRPATECARIHCGYQYRCHAATPAL
jgi:ATP-dependent exoDNAse (exonuclease V) beta subunit